MCRRCTNYFCFCFDLEIGTFIVAIIDLIWEFALLYMFVMAIYESILKWHEQLVFILSIIRIISICVLIHGVQKVRFSDLNMQSIWCHVFCRVNQTSSGLGFSRKFSPWLFW